jgi:heavy metal sensor kinase
MRHPRSLRFKLITLYVCLLTIVFLGFGAYIYLGFQQFLVRSLKQTLLRRADQIAVTILDQLPVKGESYVASEIQARYAPELNERVIRITDTNHREIYASKNAHFLSNYPSQSQAEERDRLKPLYQQETSSEGHAFEVVSLLHPLSNGSVFIVDVGAPLTDIQNALHDLLLTLFLGFPVLIGLAVLGGYSLLGRALRPVDEIVSSAERITFKDLNQRLPVPHTGDEFERISQALNRMIERLHETFQIANRFSGDASHELRTPLTIIQGELEAYMKEPSLSPESLERVGNILEEVLRLSRIVEGLLLVSRLEGGEAQMKRGIIDLGELVTMTAEQMELLSQDKLLTLEGDISPHVLVEGDELRLRQVIVNVMDNAIKYTPEGGTILLKVYAKRDKAFIEIIDTGIGISATALPQIFNRFFRAEEAKSALTQGSGLGLAIVHSITEAHRGSVHVESNKNQGTKFRIELPLLRQETSKTNRALRMLA